MLLVLLSIISSKKFVYGVPWVNYLAEGKKKKNLGPKPRNSYIADISMLKRIGILWILLVYI